QEVTDHDEDAQQVGRQRGVERPAAKQPQVDHRVGEGELAAGKPDAYRQAAKDGGGSGPGDPAPSALFHPEPHPHHPHHPHPPARPPPGGRPGRTKPSRPAPGSRYSASKRGPSTSSNAITGTANRNTEPHQNCSSSTPPSIGPMAPPAEKAVIQIPMAVERCWGSGNMMKISDSVEGARVAPPMPSSARAPISISGLVEKAASTETTPKQAAPPSSTRRRPRRSPRVPMVIRNPATMKL